MSQNILILVMNGDTLSRPQVRNVLSMELPGRLVDTVNGVKRSTRVEFVAFQGQETLFAPEMTEKKCFPKALMRWRCFSRMFLPGIQGLFPSPCRVKACILY